MWDFTYPRATICELFDFCDPNESKKIVNNVKNSMTTSVSH